MERVFQAWMAFRCIRRPPIILSAALLLAASAAAADLSGRVVCITDGDTLKVYDGHRQVKVRLAEIDAPEKRQPFGERSRQSLASICFQKPACVQAQGGDRYGRTIGRVFCAGVDANAEQVRHGMAWVYDRYVRDRSLYALQDEAREARRGLWSDPFPAPPWLWRKQLHNPQ